MLESIPMTKEGYDRLKAELDQLKKVVRPDVIKSIAEARAHGDLSENAEYHAAREKQGMVESKIRLTEHKLASARIINPDEIDSSKIVFGKIVLLKDTKSGREVKYNLVGAEAEYKKGEISVTSPLGNQLLGHEVGDKVTVKLPARTVEYKIMEIS